MDRTAVTRNTRRAGLVVAWGLLGLLVQWNPACAQIGPSSTESAATGAAAVSPSGGTYPQDPLGLWREASPAAFPAGAKVWIEPQPFRAFRLDRSRMEALLAQAPRESAQSVTDSTSLVTLPLPEGGFAVAIDDVLARHAVYVPAFHAFIAEATANVDLDGYRSSIAGRETILEQVRKMPDQTREQALARVHRVEQDRQPTMLSLACDNHKFIVNRDGVMQFAVLPDPDKPIPPDTHRYPCRITPTFGSGRNEKLSRHLAGGWYPAPVVSVVDGGVAYQMCSFVTPFDGGTARGANPWLDPRPLYVAAFTIGNAGDQPAEASLTLSFLAEAAANLPAEMQIVGDRAVVRMPSSSAQAAKHPVLAVVDASEAAPLKLSDRPGGVILQGRLAARQEVRCRLYVPAWPLKADEQATLVGGETLWNGFTAYWDRVMASAMQVQVPDEFLMDVIRASQVHCLLAARNEEGARRVAAWTASVSYGPLESESHSIIRGMALMGHEEFARRSLDYFIHRYDPAGFLTVGYTLMGTGWHLQTLGEFYELTRNQGWLKANAPASAARLLECERRMAELSAQMREAAEAMDAGSACLSQIEAIQSELGSAEGWGTWDLLGGGFISDVAKHSHLDQAQNLVNGLQACLRRFRTELADVTVYADLQIQIDGFLRFADYIFDGVFADWAVLDRIHDSQARVENTRAQIEAIMHRLNDMYHAADREGQALRREYDEIVRRA